LCKMIDMGVYIVQVNSLAFEINLSQKYSYHEYSCGLNVPIKA